MAWINLRGIEGEAVRDLMTASDRATAIMGATLVEARLKAALEQNFQRNDEIEGEMFRSSGPLGSFAAKIHMVCLLGLISPDAHRDLSIMKAIRNKFAHDIEIRDFTSVSISDRCKNFALIDRHFEDSDKSKASFKRKEEGIDIKMGIDGLDEKLADPRWRYLMTAMLFTAALSFPVRVGSQRI
jgi:DNA-binding MltR family transcriptional regulator